MSSVNNRAEERQNSACDDRPPTVLFQPPREHTKFVRILTVIGYVICVSSGAIMLSLYYIFLWDPYRTPPTPDYMPQTANMSACAAYIQQAQRLKQGADAIVTTAQIVTDQ